MHHDKKLPVSISLLLLLLSILAYSLNNIAIATDPSPTLYVYPNSYAAASVGKTVSIQVMISVVYYLTAYQFELRFNTTLLHCLSASTGSMFPPPPNSTSTIEIDNTQGIVSIQAHLLGGTNISGWGSLLSMGFNATYGTPYPQPNDVGALEIVNDTLNGTGSPPQTILHDVTNGMYKAPTAPPQLNLTLNTNKNNYYWGERIIVNGILTGNGYPILDALVPLEIQDPRGKLLVARTFQTSNISVSCPLQITVFTPCDSGGSPQESFSVGSFAYFKVTVENTGSSSLNALVLVNPYDASNVSLGVIWLTIAVPAGGTGTMVKGLPLDNAPYVIPATSGNATANASVWTNFVENGGTPLSLENETTFTITGTPQGHPTFMNPPQNGTYQTNLGIQFRKGAYDSGLPPNYTINVAATYLGNNATQSKQIQITIGGDIDKNGQVDLGDLVILANAYDSKPGSPNWNPAADIDGNGQVDLGDLVILAVNYGEST